MDVLLTRISLIRHMRPQVDSACPRVFAGICRTYPCASHILLPRNEIHPAGRANPAATVRYTGVVMVIAIVPIRIPFSVISDTHDDCLGQVSICLPASAVARK